ncbi:hypothetical protein EJ03DRAFT_375481 [Teratosphaeria nubilosa]|uniref:Uncharacterized protein n=1 Tax=Teratosphaeria nubilosa TaxID=161662 RepID=A0A6G1L5X5_9PEZI|nr:hypothetical protein EJ03DRAFT_375481 [Teratosphaeria nubilosa]
MLSEYNPALRRINIRGQHQAHTMIHVPQFFVIARVVGSDGAFPKWKERLVPLCAVSKTEPQSTSYYWGQDVDCEPDTLWGLEGYAHAVGFFLGHPASGVFKEEMRKVDKDKLLRNVQGLGSPDYDLHHYDMYGGFLTRQDDDQKDCQDSFVVVIHFWAHEGKRKTLLDTLQSFADEVKASEKRPSIVTQSCAVMRECRDMRLATLYVRMRSRSEWDRSKILDQLHSKTQPLTEKSELHRSQAFNGHIDQEPPVPLDQ